MIMGLFWYIDNYIQISLVWLITKLLSFRLLFFLLLLRFSHGFLDTDPNLSALCPNSVLAYSFLEIQHSFSHFSVIYFPTEMNGGLESKSSCLAAHQGTTRHHFIAWTNSPNTHINPSWASLVFFFFHGRTITHIFLWKYISSYFLNDSPVI